MRALTEDEMNELLGLPGVKASIGEELGRAKLGNQGPVANLSLNGIRAQGGKDWFTAIGIFHLSFTGEYSRVGGTKIKLDGTFVLTDKYDWQNPGDKEVPISGVRIKNSYFTLVEDRNLAKPFEITGTVKRVDTYDTALTKPGGGKGGSYGGY